MGTPPRRGPGGRGYAKPPEELPAFPDAFKVKSKTGRKGAALRRRWKDPDGTIYEWDSQHETVEKYDKNGNHVGEYDPYTGKELASADKRRTVEP
jgi:hypothetical protein